MNERQEAIIRKAVEYASRGWRVLPVGYHKNPLIKNWTAEASTDKKQIMEWWIEHPNANIGVATGKESGIWVLDIDVKEDVNGLESLKQYFGESLTIEDNQLIQQTPSGGFHLFFKWDDEHPAKTDSRIGGLDGVDIRGEGGQILMAPSAVLVDGQFVQYKQKDNTEPVEMSDWAKQLVSMGGTNDSSFDLKGVMEGIPQGDRDNQILKYAWHLKSREIDYGLAEGFIKEACKRAKPPFDENVAIEKLQRAYSVSDENNKKDNTSVLELIKARRSKK